MSTIAILDMGGQYTHLLARRIRQLGVYSEIKQSDASPDELKHCAGLILSGGPSSVYEKDSPQHDPRIFEMKTPVLGLCYGHHLMAQHLGGKVTQGKTKEYGITSMDVLNTETLFVGLNTKEQVWMSHGDEVQDMPEGFTLIGTTESCKVAAMADEARKYYGLQFHPEVTHTPHGMAMLDNFVKLCGCKRNFSVKTYKESISKTIEEKAQGRKVFLLVSGGVDSTTCYALLEKVLSPENVYGLFIDNGFVRKHEDDYVRKILETMGVTNFHIKDSSKDFLDALKEVYDPEEKRRIIGEKFIEVQQKVTEELGLNASKWLLAQGTIYPDTIETGGTKNADLIKTHHNRVPLIQEMIKKGLVLEPLAGLYKDEVRELALDIGLPPDIVNRHPFPGPGLAVRCLCAKGPDMPKEEEQVKENIQKIVNEKAALECCILPLRSVGVQGDARSYRHPVALIGAFPGWNVLEKISTKITNSVKEVNRVLFLVTGLHEKSCQVHNGYVSKDRLDLLREADDIVTRMLHKEKVYDDIWQFPVVLLPVGVGGESIVLRPVESKEAMTARFAHLQYEYVKRMADRIKELPGIDAVFYDITNKPPGTIEWE